MCQSCGRNWAKKRSKRLGIPWGTVSEKRKENLLKSYYYVSWNWKTMKITNMGFGDAPVFVVQGRYRSLRVVFKSCSRGGVLSRISFYDKKGKLVYSTTKAVQTNSSNVKDRIDFLTI